MAFAKAIRERLSGNEAVATALKQINPDVVAAYPITPSTEVVHYFAQYYADGEVNTEFVAVESEHSAMSACIGAASAGGRSATVTAACGLALMWELLYVASGTRLPITLAVVNRALSGPININNDHSDSMGARDSGWIQLYAENNQEAYDNYICSVRIAEHKDVQLPVMSCQDGFITSHAIENIELLEDAEVKKFVGKYNCDFNMLSGTPTSVGPYDTPMFYFEHQYQRAMAMKNSKQVILDVYKEFAKLTGREYGLFEEYRCEDAERVIVVLNSSAGTAKYTCDKLREKGEKVGVIKIRVFRPFPLEELAAALSKFKAVAVMDKADSFSGIGGPVFTDVRHACYELENRPHIINYIYGLGGRDVTEENFVTVYNALAEVVKTGKTGEIYRHVGVRGV
ncbi:MAG: pyruvate ferredoxin oxidoreductase [Defluviitaleaceae bacterium]|nr:pyruvate ferredoxin oxidoreductase [Defluviitaleaceae bacterium]